MTQVQLGWFMLRGILATLNLHAVILNQVEKALVQDTNHENALHVCLYKPMMPPACVCVVPNVEQWAIYLTVKEWINSMGSKKNQNTSNGKNST